jgi:pyridoxine 5-phosphate synthase
VKNLIFLQEVIKELKSSGIRTSIFVDTNKKNIVGAKKTGTDRIELYTEPYAALYPTNREKAVLLFAEAAQIALNEGLEVNAGHDLNLENLKYFVQNVEGVSEVSIGHALISDALYYGLENTIQMYLKQLSI